MPWKEASPMDQRTQFMADYLRDVLSITELCTMYGVTRKTGYKWIDRVPAPGAGRAGGALATTAASAQPDGGRDRRGDSRGPAAPPELGRQEAAGPAAPTPSPVGPAGALHGVRHSELRVSVHRDQEDRSIVITRIGRS